MTLLAGVLYDPSTAASKATSSLVAMTAVDTTNCRVTFTVPSNGRVFVRLFTNVHGAAGYPQVMLGVLEGATVRGRQMAVGSQLGSALATDFMALEASFVVGGLTAGASLTWDAAYGVEAIQSSSVIGWGGPNNTTANDAFGGFGFEVHDAIPCLGSVLYDPGTAASVSMASLLSLVSMDQTNLRIAFKAPTSGNVFWRLRIPWQRGTTVWGAPLLGIVEAGSLVARANPTRGLPNTSSAATSIMLADVSGVITGLTPGSSHTYDAAYAVQVVATAGVLKWGGPNNTVANDAWGAASYEIWAV